MSDNNGSSPTGRRQMRRTEEARLIALRQAIIDGEQSGPSEPFDFDAFIADRRGSGRP
jgi:Arc/MetJ-type ribon-helix-helix transcriptional regulator